MIIKFRLIGVESEKGASYGKYRSLDDPKIVFHVLLNSETAYYPKELVIRNEDKNWSLIDSDFTPTITRTNGKESERPNAN